MKQLIKAIAPTPVLNVARDLREWPRLRARPVQVFDTKNLWSADRAAVSAMLEDSSTDAGWDEDHKTITALFGDENKMGGVNPGDRKALYYLVRALKPKNVLEVGTHIGASTLYIARALKRIAKKGKVSTVDIMDVNDAVHGPWKEAGLPEGPRDMATRLECAAHIDFHTCPCLELMATIKTKYDLIFLDGDHTAQAVYQEVSAALSILNKGGALLLHDYYPGAKPLFPDGHLISGPFRALQRIRKENRDIDVLPLGALPWPTKQGTNITSLALVVKGRS